MTDVPTYSFDRLFGAPRHMVWKVWTDPSLLRRWYGPNVETVIHEYDLKPDGIWLNEMKWGGKSDYSKMVFQEIVPLSKLVWRHYSTDKSWNNSANPMMPDWPRALLTTVTFADEGIATQVRLTQSPINPTDSEAACFAKFMGRMDSGWGSGYAIIDSVLAELNAQTEGAPQP